MLWHVDGRPLFSGDSLGRFVDSGLAFDRLFCGYGWSHDAPADSMRGALVDLAARMP